MVPAGIDNWTCMTEIKSVADYSKLRFGFLIKLAKLVLILPHSNEDSEKFIQHDAKDRN